MEIQPVNLSELFGVVLGTSIVLIPVLGLTLRFAVKPLIESLGKAFPTGAKLQLEVERLSRRVQELEDAQDGKRMLPAARIVEVRDADRA